MQCDECSYYKRNCTNPEAEDTWEELAMVGECPGYYGKETARIE